MRMRLAAAAALAASLALVPGTAGAQSSGVVPRGQPAWVTLNHAVAVVAGGTAGAGEVAVAEGVVGFPVAVTESGATGGAGSVPDGACLALLVHGRQVGHGQADAHGRFALQGPVPPGAVATVRWGPCSGDQYDQQHQCHNVVPHSRNPNKDEAADHTDAGCAPAGDAGPDS